MNNFVASKNAKITDIKGIVHIDSGTDIPLNVGDNITAGTEIVFSENSEITLTFNDGSQQRVSSDTLSIENIEGDINSAEGNETPDTNSQNAVLDDINAIQELIESGDDVELPDTAAGDILNNSGGSFTTLTRNAEETIAQAGYDTIELTNDFIIPDVQNTEINAPVIPTSSASELSDGDETLSVPEDGSLSGNLLTNAASTDGSPVITEFTVDGNTFIVDPLGTTTTLAEGELTINPNGTFTFVPTADYNGPVPEVVYTISDGVNTDTSTLNIDVTPESDLTDGDETLSVPEDGTLNGNLLTNAASTDGTPVITEFTVGGNTFTVDPLGTTTRLAEGELTINPNGTFTFVPTADYNGPVPEVVYTISDGINTDTSTLNIDVTPESDLTDGDETLSVPEDGSLSGNLLTNAASTDGTPVITEFTVGGNTFTVDPLGTTTTLAEGELTINPNGTFTFVPTADYNGPVPEVLYTISDGVNTDTSTLNIDVTPESPTSELTDGNETLSVPEDGTLNGNLLTNAASTDGTPVITEFTVGGNTFTVDPLGTTTTLAEGELTIDPNGTFTFVPTADYNGPVPEVLYTISDGVNTDTSTLNIDVTPESDLTDGDETLSVPEDGSLSGNLLTNAASTDGTPVITEFTAGGNTFTVDPLGTTATLAEGELTINPNGTFTFVPTADYNGPVPEVVYTISDGVNTDTSTLNIDVTPESDLTDGDETLSVPEDGTLNGNLLTNAASTDGTPTITEFTVGGNTFTVDPLGTTATLAEGELTINPNGTFTFVPTADYNGPVPEVVYTISDGVNTDTSTLNIDVTPESPTSELTDGNETLSVPEDGSLSGNLLTNAASTDGTPVITEFTVGGNTFTVDPLGTTATLTEGELTIHPNGTFTFVPTADYNGPVPEVVYTISDGVNTDTSTLNIDVTPESDLTDDNEILSVPEDGTLNGNLLTNAASTDGTPVITEFTVGGNTFTVDPLGTAATLTEGELTIHPNGTFTFVPTADYNGPVPEVIYTISDGVNTDTSTLNIDVTPESDLTDDNETLSVPEDGTLNGNLLTNAASTDGTPVITEFTVGGNTFTVDPLGTTATLAEGELTIHPNGTFTFVPTADYNGPVPEVVYTISDGVNTDTSTLNIDVTPESDLTDDNETLTIGEDNTLNGNLLTNASSTDGTPVITEFTVGGNTFTVDPLGTTTRLAEGELTINPNGTFTFVPTADYNGPVPEVVYTISDGVNTDTSTLNIDVTPESDLTDDNEVLTTAEDTDLSGNLLTNAASTDGTPVITEFTVGGNTFTVDPLGTTTALTEGELTIHPNGTFTFVPTADYNGPVPEVIYTISDGVNTDTSTLNIDVTPESDLTDDNETLSVPEDGTLNGNLLTNTASTDGTPVITEFTVGGNTFTVDPLGTTATLAEGELTIHPNGTFTFVPTADYNGPVPEVVYTISDGVNTDTSTLNIDVTPESDLTDDNETLTIGEDNTLNGNLLTNASSTDGTPVITEFTVGGNTFTVDPLGTTTRLAEGELTINPNGTFTFVPTADYNGPVPEVVYTISDGVNTDTSTLNIDVTPESDLTDDNEVLTTAEDTDLSGNLLTNAASTDGTPTITEFTVGGNTFTVDPLGTTTRLAEGELTINPNGTFTFVPTADYNGPVPEVVYTISDGVNTDTSTLNIDVTPESDLTDDNEVLTTAEDTDLSGNLLTNAASTDGTPVITEFTVGGNTFTVDPLGTTTALTEGELTIHPNGTFTFVPTADYNGPVPEVIYTISDGVNTDTSTLNIDVTPESDLTDDNETLSVPEDGTLNGNLLTNTASTDGTPVITEFTVGGNTFTVDPLGTTATLAEGELTIHPNGTFTFVPTADYNGPVPEVVYTISDGVNTDTSTLNIDVTPESDLTDDNETLTIGEDNTLNGNLLTNASSTDGTPVITEFTVGGNTFTVDPLGTTTRLAEGELTINPNGTFTFVPTADYNGPVPEVVYTISDGVNTDTSTLNIDVTPSVNIPPTAENDSFTVHEGEMVSGNVITHNDGDGKVDSDGGDGAALSVTQVNGNNLIFDPADGYATIAIQDGILRINAQGNFTYQNSGFTGGTVIHPSFDYTLSDGTDTDTATVSIEVSHTAPTANADNNFITLMENDSGTAAVSRVKGNLIARGSSGDVNDTSPDGIITLTHVSYNGTDYIFNSLNTSFEIVAEYGTFTVKDSGAYTYTSKSGMLLPANDVSDVISYTIQDGDTVKPDSDTTTLTIHIDVPDPVPTPAPSPLLINNINDIAGASFSKSATIDTSNLQKVSAIDTLNTQEETAAPTNELDLSDLISDGSSNSIDQFLQFANEDEEITTEPTPVDEQIESIEQVVLEKTEHQSITNGLLVDGAVIISDNTAPTTIPLADLDSSDIL
ncbi:retention module-containing protein [Colwellia sp. RE-S-Sl-9]